MTPAAVLREHQRQVHLDFHTSPFIPDVGAEFDGRAFAATMKRARVNSVTLFAKCHHGMCYYPTRTGVPHPALAGRDLLGEQIEALHREGIRAPIYTTVVWEENVADRFPQWRQMAKDGHFAGLGEPGPDGKPGHVGMWRFNNPLDPGYQDYIEAHLREILARYGGEVDGFFLDILFFAPDACWSEASMKFRAKLGLLGDDRATFERFQGAAQKAFAAKFSRIIRGARPGATIFYNAQNDASMTPGVGPRARAVSQTHCEIESLPSGFWGYFHFPRMARAQSAWGKPWLGMTGRFQKMWGDFGGIKPQPALEFECFRAQALGGGNSIGDQLPPRGELDAGAYDLIGAVYAQCEEAEPFYEGSGFAAPRAGVFSASRAGHDGGKSEEGAVLLCEEAHYDCAVLDAFDDLRPYNLLVLPDTTAVDAALARRLREFHRRGGKLLLSYRSGFDPAGKCNLGFLPLAFHGETDKFPTFWRARASFLPGMARSDRVFYGAGMRVSGGRGAEAVMDRVLPYFRRTASHFCSHFHTPPVAEPDEFPALLRGCGFYYFADPVFREYRQTGNFAVREAWRAAMLDLVGPPSFGAGLPPGVQVYPRRKGRDLLLTLLHYVPVRKALDIDVIDDRGTFAGEVLRLPQHACAVEVFPSGERLQALGGGAFALPATKGRLLLRVPRFFGAQKRAARR